MDESYFKEKLSAYLDKDLPPEEMAMMDQYVAEHEEARRILDEYRKLNDLVEKHSGLGESDYWERSARKIEEAIGFKHGNSVTDIRPKGRTGFVWKITAVAASAALLIFIGVHQWDILERQKDEMVPSETRTTTEAGHGVPDSAAVAESTQVFEAEGSIESQSGEGAPTQAEIKPMPKVADELGDIDKSVGIPKPPPAPEPEKVVKAPLKSPTPQKEGTTSKGTEVNASLSRKQSDLGQSIHLNSVPPSPTESDFAKTADTLHIRGGRAGETDYVIDSEAALSTEGYLDQADMYADLDERAEKAGDTAYVIPQKLTSYQRDSLLTYYRAERELFMEKPADIKPSIQQPSLTPGFEQEKPKSRPKLSVSSPEKKAPLAPEDEKRMLTASYVVAMLSPDDSEREQASDYIKLVAEDTASVHNALAAEYLKELETRRVDQK